MCRKKSFATEKFFIKKLKKKKRFAKNKNQ